MDINSLRFYLEKLEEYSKNRSYSQDYFERYLFKKIWETFYSPEEESFIDSARAPESNEGDTLYGFSAGIEKTMAQVEPEDIPRAEVPERNEEVPETKVLYGGYIPPFKWDWDYNKCTISDAVGDVLYIRCKEHPFNKIVHEPLFEKLTKMLEPESVTEDYPIFKCSLERDIFHPEKNVDVLYVNGFEVSFAERLGADGSCTNNLKDFLYTKLFSTEDLTFYQKLLSLNLLRNSHWECFNNYLSNTFPVYKMRLDTCNSRDEAITEYARMFYLQGNEKWDDIVSFLQKPLEDFYGKDIETQKQQDIRLSLAITLAERFGIEDQYLWTLSDSIGAYLSCYNKYFSSITDLENWQKEHDLLNGDILAPKTNWAESIFLFDKYSDFASFVCSETMTEKNIKYFDLNTNYYEPKISYLSSRDIELIEAWYNKNASNIKPEEKIEIPIPYWEEKKNKPEVVEWLRMNIFMMGFTTTKKAASDFYTLFLSIKDTYFTHKKTNKFSEKAIRHFSRILTPFITKYYKIDNSLEPDAQIPNELAERLLSAMISLTE